MRAIRFGWPAPSFYRWPAECLADDVADGGRDDTGVNGLGVGAAVLSISDVVAEHAIDNFPMPVGAVTVSIGGLYLVWLLAVENRRR